MVKSREAIEPTIVNCSFCGHHKNDVPLLVTCKEAAVCTYCAMGVFEQTMVHAMKMEKKLRILMTPPPPKIEIVPAGNKVDKVDVAIGKALNNGK